MAEYCGIEIKCDKLGAQNGGLISTRIESCTAIVKGRIVTGTLEEVKQQIDEVLQRKEHKFNE